MDDICLGVQDGAITRSDLPATQAGDLGPLLELRHSRPGLLLGNDGPSWLATPAYDELLSNLQSDSWFAGTTARQGCISVPALQRDELAWTNFVLRIKRGAIATGFSDDHSGKMTAAIGEFYANVLDHSQNTSTGYVVYSAMNGRFEFVVADSGIGVLASLRTNPAYNMLADAGYALELALGEGVSRHHKEEGHGYGFRPLFVGLANISQYVRFRSGDCSRHLRRNQDGSIDARTSQLSDLPGFFCHVLCAAR